MLLHSDAAATFIEVEVSTAELFADLASQATETTTRERLLQIAREACDSAERFFPRTHFQPSKHAQIQGRLSAVEAKLQQMDYLLG